MNALCFAHAERGRLAGSTFRDLNVPEGSCRERGCRGLGYYVPVHEPFIPAPAEAPPKEEKRIEQPRLIPCDRTRTCPHCVLGTITPVSAAYIPRPSGWGGQNTREEGPWATI